MNYEEILKLILIIVGVITITIFEPIFSVIILAIPISINYYEKKISLLEMIFSLIITLIIIVSFFGIYNALIFTSFSVINFLVLKYVFSNKKNALESQMILTASMVLSITLIFIFLNNILGMNLLDYFSESILKSKEILVEQKIFPSSDIEFKSLLKQLMSLIPFVVLLISVIASSIMYFVYRIILIRNNENVVKIGKFSDFKLPMHFIYGTTLILLLSYISGYLNLVNFNSISFNVILIIVYTFALQGIAIMFSFLDKHNISKVYKGMLLGSVLLFGGIFMLSVVGWLDMMFNFRKIEKSE